MHGFGGSFGGWSFFGLHAVWWLFWIVLIVAALAYFASLPRGRRPQSRPGRTALEQLQYRYANGEMSTADYEERKKELEQDGAPETAASMRANGK